MVVDFGALCVGFLWKVEVFVQELGYPGLELLFDALYGGLLIVALILRRLFWDLMHFRV